MNISKWTQVLVSAGLISVPAAVRAADAEAEPTFVQTAVASTTLSGYVDTTMIWAPGSGNANLPGRVYDGSDVQDGFNLNLVSVNLTKPLDDSEWSAGYHVQMLFGPFAAKRGTGSIVPVPGTGVPASTIAEFAFNEAYVNLRVPIGNGIEFHIGQFGTFNGYEAFDSYKDPNWSRSYGFFNETSAHTGVAAFYKFGDWLSVQGGIGNVGPFNSQVDARATEESQKAYLGMATLTAPESWGFLKGATLSAGYTVGPHVGGGEHVQQIYVGGNLPLPITGLTLGYAYDYTAGIAQFAVGPGATGGYANAAALYLLWQATEKLKLNARFDYTSATQGWYGPTGVERLGSITATVDYSLWKNVVSRAEIRWDHALDGTEAFGGSVAGTGDDVNAVSIMLNFIYLF
jgi:hypothetical protein